MRRRLLVVIQIFIAVAASGCPGQRRPPAEARRGPPPDASAVESPAADPSEPATPAESPSAADDLEGRLARLDAALAASEAAPEDRALWDAAVAALDAVEDAAYTELDQAQLAGDEAALDSLYGLLDERLPLVRDQLVSREPR